MNEMKIEEFGYLWDGTDPGWVLVNDPVVHGGASIYNKIGGCLLHVESAEFKELLCKKLREVGVEILNEFPPGTVVVKPAK